MFRKHLDYTNRDFTSIRSDLLMARTGLTTSWDDNNSNDIGIALLELFAYVGDNLNYYIDRAVNESFIYTATQRQSMMNLCSWLGYTPTPTTTPTTIFQYSCESTGIITTIVSGTQVTIANGEEGKTIIFETTEGLDIASGNTSGTVVGVAASYVSGETVGTGDGNAYQKYRINNSPLSYYNNAYDISVYVNAVLWSQQSDFGDSTSGSTHYKIEITEQDIPYVVFGDGVYGEVPTLGDSIIVNYRYGGGEEGNNVSVGRLTKILSTVPDNVTACTNTVTSSGGMEKENIEKIRSNLPKFFKTRNRIVTLDDFKYFCDNYAGIAFSRVYADGDAVQIIVVPDTGGIPSDYLKKALDNYLKEYKLLGVKVTINDPTYRRINMKVHLNIEDGYIPNTVGTNVGVKLREYLNPIKKDVDGNYLSTFGKDVHVSKIYHVIEEVSGVDSAKIMTLFSDTYLSDSDVLTTTISNVKEKVGVKDISIGEQEIAVPGQVLVTSNYGMLYASFFNPDDLRATQHIIEKTESL